MKIGNKIFIILFLLFFFSCPYMELDLSLFPMPDYNIKIPGLKEELNKYNNLYDKLCHIKNKVYEIIEYKIFSEEYNPEEIMKIKKGDCCEYATLFGWLVWKYLGIKSIFYDSKKYNKWHRHVYISKCNRHFMSISGYTIKISYDFENYYKYIEYIK